MSQIIKNSTGGGGGGGIINIDGDVGSITGSTVSITGLTSAGSTVSFSAGSSTNLDLNLSDINGSTILGSNAGNSSISGVDNVGVGRFTLNALTNASGNTAIGYGAGENLTSGGINTFIGNSCGTACVTGQKNTCLGSSALLQGLGSNNIAIGWEAGANYTSTESSNILIGNVGTSNESNVIKLGSQGSGSNQQNITYIVGPVLCEVEGNSSAPAFSFAGATNCGMLTDGNNTYISGSGFATGTFGFNVTLSGGITSISQGVVKSSINAKNTNFTCVYADYFYPIDSSGGAITATLMNNPIAGQELVFKDNTNSAATNNITISGVTSGKNIDGITTAVINTNGGCFTLFYNGTQWNIKSKA